MPHNQPTQLAMSVEETATSLGVSTRTVYRAIRNGELAAIRFRGRWLVPVGVLTRLLDHAESNR